MRCDCDGGPHYWLAKLGNIYIWRCMVVALEVVYVAMFFERSTMER